jgi:parallel beta-helix repeat protein
VENLSVIDVVLRGNHTRGSDADATGVTSSRVVKVAMSRGLLIDNMESYENYGSGLWLDYKNSDYTIQNSYFHHNRGIVVEGEYRKENGRGVYLEKNWGPGLVENNVIADNQGAGIVIVNSNGVSFKHNLLLRNEQSVQLLNMTGSGYEEFTLQDVAFRGTYMKGWRSAASVWARGGDFSASPADMRLSMDESVYQLGSTGFLVQWPGPIFGARSLPQIQAKYGWETRGRLDSIPW